MTPLLLLACATANHDWPDAELQKLRVECESSPVPGTDPTTCECLYDRLPAVVHYEDFAAWRAAPAHEGAARDPGTTRKVAQVSEACAKAAPR
jgi:hypothetical protein